MSPDDDEDECRDCVDVFVRTNIIKKTVFVFSRAIAAIESLLCLT